MAPLTRLLPDEISDQADNITTNDNNKNRSRKRKANRQLNGFHLVEQKIKIEFLTWCVGVYVSLKTL